MAGSGVGVRFNVTYRSGPLAADDGSSGTLYAGDRAPALGGCSPLYAGPDWTLLRFGSAAPRLHHLGVRSHDIGTDILDADLHIQQAYGVKNCAAILVRPDGHIGAITHDPPALLLYANRVLTRRPSASAKRSH